MTTVNVSIALVRITRAALPYGRVKFELTVADRAGAIVVPQAEFVTCDVAGLGSVALMPNGNGTQGTRYAITVLDAMGAEQWSGYATVPASDCNLHDILDMAAAPALSDAQAAEVAAQAYASQAGASAAAAAADRAQADLDAQATAADRAQADIDAQATGVDRAAASALVSQALAVYGTTADLNAAQQIMLGYADTASAQAALAAASAASAAGVLQQDLSAVTAQALHRSPNAIAALFVYDTSRDSDGGAWVDRCAHTSWMNEALNGAWRGACATEAACRAISGATTGDYFQLTTDGKFYKLNAGAGTTEVFRGNSAKAPRLALAVGEATSNSVTVFAGDQAGRPMWGRWVFASATFGNIASIACRDGKILVGTSLGLITLDLVRDMGRFQQAAADSTFALTSRASGSQALLASPVSQNIVNNAVNAVAMTVLPDAPLDLTGLPVPTIAVATAGGVSVIKHDGTVVNSSSTVNFGTVALDPYLLFAGYANATGSVMAFASSPGQLGASFGLTTMNPNTGSPDWVRTGGSVATIISKRGEVARVPTNTAQIALLRHNASSTTASLAAIITPTYNTGWMTGDIRRCWLSDTLAGTAQAVELVTNGTFNTDATGWSSANAGTLSVSSGEMLLTNGSAAVGRAVQGIATVIGRTYVYTATVRNGTSNAAGIGWSTTFGSIAGGSITTASTTNTLLSLVFTATATTTYVALSTGTVTVGQTAYYDNVSVQEIAADRGYKNKPLTILGTLSKTAVAAAAQLMFYSGWSATNYLQEPYSADLDFGTGAWSVSAWVSYTTAAASTIFERAAATGGSIKLGTDAAGKLTATAYDGTTTRTVTSPAAYNTTTPIKVRVEYATSGSLTLKVNGQQVAQTTGTPLLTLNNASAVTTIGNDRSLATAFVGSIALVKAGATVPSVEQSLFMYAQEQFLFQPSAQCTLPDAGAVVDLAYDDMQDRWKVASAANESSFTGLVRTSLAAVPAGSFTKAAHRSGVKLLARSTTTPGVDVTIPAYGLREELVNRAERAAALARLQQPFDFDAITAQTDFALPVGYTAIEVLSGGASKREGATKDYTRLFDGFRETVRFAVAPGNTVWVQIIARRAP